MILLVEDDRAVREALVEYLRLLHYEVEGAADPAKALSFALHVEGCPELLITDINMPEMTGPEMATKLKKLWPGLKVIFITGFMEDDTLSDAEFPAARILAKPFAFDTLIQTIQQVLEPSFDAYGGHAPLPAWPR